MPRLTSVSLPALAVLVSVMPPAPLRGLPAAAVSGNPAAEEVLRGPHYTVRVEGRGGIRIQVGGDQYLLESSLSFPGPSIGWNRLGAGHRAENGWTPQLKRGTGESVELFAQDPRYSCTRTVRIDGHRVVVTDTLTNTSQEDVAVIYRHRLYAEAPYQERLLAGIPEEQVRMTAENPSAFVAQARSRLGWLAEDAVLRLQLALSATGNQVEMVADRFALAPRARHTFRWALYPLRADADYWTFVNQVRRDWDVNFAIQGPFDFFDVTEKIGLIRDPERLKAYLARKRLTVVALMPWVDYENYSFLTGRPLTRPELKSLLQEARDAFKRLDPEILTIGCIEGNLVSLPEDAQKALWESAPGRPQNQYPLSDDQMALLRKYDLRWNDSLLQNKDGRYRYELYYRGPEGRKTPMIAVAVFAAPGNGQHQYWLDQARFLLEEVGLDGLYIDQFNMAFNDDQRYSYHAWDGTTVDIDPHTSRIARRYTDAALVGVGARKDLADYVLRKGRYMLANTFAAVPELQSVRMHRFNESEWSIDPLSWGDGEKPPLRLRPSQGHFSTPIALGFRISKPGKTYPQESYARLIMKGVIAYLRHGLLYYHYFTEIPESGPGAGEYGPINHMFPLTPVELHAGWIVGRERIVACVSGTYCWPGAREPRVRVFDLDGRAVGPRAEVSRKEDHWQVQLRLKDWAEIAVIEP